MEAEQTGAVWTQGLALLEFLKDFYPSETDRLGSIPTACPDLHILRGTEDTLKVPSYSNVQTERGTC